MIAYEVLSDSETRNIYDKYGEEGLKQHAASGGRGGGMGVNIQDIFSSYVIFSFFFFLPFILFFDLICVMLLLMKLDVDNWSTDWNIGWFNKVSVYRSKKEFLFAFGFLRMRITRL